MWDSGEKPRRAEAEWRQAVLTRDHACFHSRPESDVAGDPVTVESMSGIRAFCHQLAVEKSDVLMSRHSALRAAQNAFVGIDFEQLAPWALRLNCGIQREIDTLRRENARLAQIKPRCLTAASSKGAAGRSPRRGGPPRRR